MMKILLSFICFVAFVSCQAQDSIQLKPWDCKTVKGNCSDECDFLKDFIDYGSAKIDSTRLEDKEYYKSFIRKTLPLEYFDSSNALFNLYKKEIKEYGKCFIAEFKFNNHYGVDQESVYVMINASIKEVYVFYFEKVIIENDSSINLIFNTRGKMSQRKIYFSKKDSLFLLDCGSIQ
ncbi:MAG: hypothetical protein H6Q15_1858 [Bacteroidetes bacterium]|nr:hypothetical protein [Bacteroidota bacterium]